MFPNFMLQDVFGVSAAFFIFPLVIVIPGYVCGWAFDLFGFRVRLLPSRFAISLLLSIAVGPILFYLAATWASLTVALVFSLLLAVIFFVLLVIEKPVVPKDWFHPAVFVVVFVWLTVAMFSLVDLQLGQNELYFSVASYDHTTRVSVVDAITRTGVPPINPSYYPGHYVKLTFLYFFWYILGGLVDLIGGPLVDARMALYASILWCGIALMTAIAFYLRMRNNEQPQQIWKKAFIGMSLLFVTGLDILPSIMVIRYGNGVVGDIEHWNEQITAWVGSLLWVPHHVASLISCLVGIMLVHYVRNRSRKEKYASLAFAGVAFASAAGLSIWVILVFVAFWGIWALALLIQKKHSHLFFPMIFAGVVALLLAGPFLLGIVSSGGEGNAGGAGAFPVTLTIRSFRILDALVGDSSLFLKLLVRFIFLPLNYLFELGFFFLVGFIWLRSSNGKLLENPYYFAEVLLLAVSFFIGTFTRSTLIENNDLGWRAWLPGQFVLLIWGVDVLSGFSKSSNSRFVLSPATKYNLVLLVAFGVASTLLDVTMLRFGYYFALGPDGGRAIFSARRAYMTINEKLPDSAIVQYNPSGVANRPVGLYGMRQSVISDRTVYGVPLTEYYSKVVEVSEIFNLRNVQSWDVVDALCKKNFIEVIVVVDSDPLWESLDLLGRQRNFIYKDDHYAVLSCGN